MKGRGLDSIPGERRLDTLEERRNREGKCMIDRSLLFSKTTFQKGRRREGVESSWCVNQRIATMMKTVLIVTVTGVYGDSQGSFPSLCSSAEPRATQGGLQGCYFTEGRHGLQRGGCLAQDYMSNYCQRWAERRETSLAPSHTWAAPHGLQLWPARKNRAFVRAEDQAQASRSLGLRPKDMVGRGGLRYGVGGGVGWGA